MTDRDTAFAEYFAARSDAMRGTAFLLCGDWHRAEDLTQTAFTKLYLAWNRIARQEALDGYVRRMLVRVFLDELKLGWWRRVRLSGSPPEPVTSGRAAEPGTENRIAVLAALSSVPPRQRAVLILRYWEDLSIEETADLLNCSAGTVKSQAARGLQALRAQLSPTFSTD